MAIIHRAADIRRTPAPMATKASEGRRRSRRSGVIAYVVVIAWTTISLAPVAWLLVQSVKPPGDVFAIPPKWFFRPSLRSYTDLLSTASGSHFARYLAMSLVVTCGTTALAVLVAVPASYSLTFLPVRHRSMWMSLIL